MIGLISSLSSTSSGAAAIATFSTSSSATSTFSMAGGIISSNCFWCAPSISRSRISSSAFFSSSRASFSLIILAFFKRSASVFTVACNFLTLWPIIIISAFNSGGAFWAARPSAAKKRCNSPSCGVNLKSVDWASLTASSSKSPSMAAVACSRASSASTAHSAARSEAFCTRSSQVLGTSGSFCTVACTTCGLFQDASWDCCCDTDMTTSSLFTSPSQGIVHPPVGGAKDF
mmetsp:Transcript_35565/g.62814  ORF Transcript_35565/g.62814 Transcript_35565/m.62814 type:complete len:231 (+) Transcript_35565:4707-5399(+)